MTEALAAFGMACLVAFALLVAYWLMTDDDRKKPKP
jgi:hypothetical protein